MLLEFHENGGRMIKNGQPATLCFKLYGSRPICGCSPSNLCRGFFTMRNTGVKIFRYTSRTPTVL